MGTINLDVNVDIDLSDVDASDIVDAADIDRLCEYMGKNYASEVLDYVSNRDLLGSVLDKGVEDDVLDNMGMDAVVDYVKDNYLDEFKAALGIAKEGSLEDMSLDDLLAEVWKRRTFEGVAALSWSMMDRAKRDEFIKDVAGYKVATFLVPTSKED